LFRKNLKSDDREEEKKDHSANRISNQIGTFFVYLKSSDYRMQIAILMMEKLIDYVMITPEDAGSTQLYAAQRDQMIENNLKILSEKYPFIKF